MRRLALTLIFIAIAGMACHAQLSAYEHPNLIYGSISPVFQLLEDPDLGNLLYDQPANNHQEWDTTQQHYTGTLLQHLYYPQLAKAGYTSFSVIKIERHSNEPGMSVDEINRSLEGSEREFEKDNGISRTTYHYDSAGWLRCISHTLLSPEYEYYGETTDSIFYQFRQDKSMHITRRKDEHSSGRNFASTSGCGQLPPFFHIYKKAQTHIMLDSFHNILRIKTDVRERWDTCTVKGPAIRSRTCSYDSEGRLVHAIDSDVHHGLLASEIVAQYSKMSFLQFMDSVKGDTAFDALRKPAIREWLQLQGPLSYLHLQAKIIGYPTYDQLTSDKNKQKPDTPKHNYTTAHFINNKRQRVVSWNDTYSGYHYQNEFALTKHWPGTSSQGPTVEIQYLPVHDAKEVAMPGANATATGVVMLKGSTHYIKDSLSINSNTLYRLMNENMVGQSDRPGSREFNTLPPVKIPNLKTQSLIITNPQGLIQYAWSYHSIYKITYHK